VRQSEVRLNVEVVRPGSVRFSYRVDAEQDYDGTASPPPSLNRSLPVNGVAAREYGARP
jgi:hypothetical protein